MEKNLEVDHATTEELTNISYSRGKIKGLKQQKLEIDKVCPEKKSLILVKNQIMANQNGIYEVKRNCDEKKPFVLIRYKNRSHDKELITIQQGEKLKNSKWVCSNVKAGKEIEYISLGTTEEVKINEVSKPYNAKHSSSFVKVRNGMEKIAVDFDTPVIVPETAKYTINVRPNDKGQNFVMEIAGKKMTTYSGLLSGGTKISVYYIGAQVPNLGCKVFVQKQL